MWTVLQPGLNTKSKGFHRGGLQVMTWCSLVGGYQRIGELAMSVSKSNTVVPQPTTA
jgi:hypothetical protein